MQISNQVIPHSKSRQRKPDTSSLRAPLRPMRDVAESAHSIELRSRTDIARVSSVQRQQDRGNTLRAHETSIQETVRQQLMCSHACAPGSIRTAQIVTCLSVAIRTTIVTYIKTMRCVEGEPGHPHLQSPRVASGSKRRYMTSLHGQLLTYI